MNRESLKVIGGLVISGVVIYLLGIWLAPILPKGVLLKEGDFYANASKLLVTLTFLAIIIERVIEVFVSINRQKGKQDLMLNISYEQDNEKKHELEKKLIDYRNTTQGVALKVGFVLGVMVAFSGIGILGAVYQEPDTQGGFYFKALDALLTAGLLAGGSKGINKISRLFSSIIDASKNNVGR